MYLLRNGLWAWGVLLIAGFGASAEFSDEKALEQLSTGQLIERLDGNQRKDRQNAEKELIRRGPSVLEQLPSPEEKVSPEVRETLLRVRTEVELRAAIESLRPSIVTLSGEFALANLSHQLENMTGNRIDLAELPDQILQKKREFRIERGTWWECMDEISRTYGVRLRMESGKPLAFLELGDSSRLESGITADSSDSVRVACLNVKQVSPVDEGTKIRIRLQFSLEPRLRGLYGTVRPRDLKVLTDSGESLSPYDPLATFEVPFGVEGKSVEIGIDFTLPPKRKIRTLRISGTADLQIAAGESRFEFKRLTDTRPQALRQGNVSVTFEPAPLLPNDLMKKRFGILVRYDTAGPSFESHRLWIFHNRTFLTTGKGNEIPPAGFETVLQQGRIVGLNYDFLIDNAKLQDASFVYFAPIRIVSHRCSFRLPESTVETE